MRFSYCFPAAVLLGSLLLAACEQSQDGLAAPLPPQVTVANPLLKPISDWDTYVGQFEARQQVSVRPRVTGYLVEILFQDGQLVAQGDLLFRIDARPFEAALAQARAGVRGAETRVNNARAELERARGLLRLEAVSQEEFDSLEATLLSAESDLSAARAAEQAAALEVEFTRITAPVAGRVSDRRVDIGNVVKADDTELTSIVSVDPIHFSFQGSEALYLKYQRQQDSGEVPVRIRLMDEADHAWEGVLDFMDNRIDSASGTIRGRALVKNAEGFLAPGMFGHMEMRATMEYPGVLLPDSAIATRGAQRIVYVVGADNLVNARLVELGPLNEGLRVIRAGLEGSERVVIDGLQRVRPGAPVEPLVGTIQEPSA